MIDNLGNCKDCRFFIFDGADIGECHRYAPRPIVINARADLDRSIYEMAEWPTLRASNFCGEFKPSWSIHETKND
ncbi:MAG: hypothetical protein CMF19_07475 [Idiomarinaceae bacterium]|nr:hypothetical protein [Idiomarinaceae bacterium]|tara:strand:- start:2208 stop:2432 length:225 start_codon:yes stop_codon:yes gene_type:complete